MNYHFYHLCSGGFVFVTFKSREDAERAVKTLNKKDLMGRPIIVDWASSPELYEALKAPPLPKPDFNLLGNNPSKVS